MNLTHEHLHNELTHILKKSIETQDAYNTASKIAKEDEVKLFLKNKADNRGLFNEKLKSVGIRVSKVSKALLPINSQSELTSPEETIIDPCDEILLMDSLKTDKQALQDFEVLLKYPTLPLSIRFIIKEQIIFIRLDELKMEQLILICK